MPWLLLSHRKRKWPRWEGCRAKVHYCNSFFFHREAPARRCLLPLAKAPEGTPLSVLYPTAVENAMRAAFSQHDTPLELPTGACVRAHMRSCLMYDICVYEKAIQDSILAALCRLDTPIKCRANVRACVSACVCLRVCVCFVCMHMSCSKQPLEARCVRCMNQKHLIAVFGCLMPQSAWTSSRISEGLCGMQLIETGSPHS